MITIKIMPIIIIYLSFLCIEYQNIKHLYTFNKIPMYINVPCECFTYFTMVMTINCETRIV